MGRRGWLCLGKLESARPPGVAFLTARSLHPALLPAFLPFLSIWGLSSTLLPRWLPQPGLGQSPEPGAPPECPVWMAGRVPRPQAVVCYLPRVRVRGAGPGTQCLDIACRCPKLRLLQPPLGDTGGSARLIPPPHPRGLYREGLQPALLPAQSHPRTPDGATWAGQGGGLPADPTPLAGLLCVFRHPLLLGWR